MIRHLFQGVNHSIRIFHPNLLRLAQVYSADLSLGTRAVLQEQHSSQSYLEINKDISEDLEQCSKLFSLIEESPSEETKKLVLQMFNGLLHESFTISNQLKVLSLAEGLLTKKININPRLLFRKNQETQIAEMQRVLGIYLSRQIQPHKSLQITVAKRIVQLIKRQGVVLAGAQVNSLLQNLCSQNLLSRQERQLRGILIKSVSLQKPQQTFVAAAYINNMLHYDFSPQQLKDVAQIFEGVASQYKNCDSITLTHMLMIGPQRTNATRLDRLFINTFQAQFPSIRYADLRSLQTNQIFNTLVSISHRIEDFSYFQHFQQFVVSYIRTKGNTKKYHLLIDQSLVKMLKRSNFKNSLLLNIKITLIQIQFVCSYPLIYEMVKREQLLTLRTEYFQVEGASNLDCLLFLIVLNKYPNFAIISEQTRKTRQKIRQRLNGCLATIDSFIQLCKEIDSYQSNELYPLLYSNFHEEISQLENVYLTETQSWRQKHWQYLEKIFYFYNYETAATKSMKTSSMMQIISKSSATLIEKVLDKALQQANHFKIQYFLPIITFSNERDMHYLRLMEKKCILLSLVYANIKQFKLNNQFVIIFQQGIEKFLIENIQQGIKSSFFLTLVQQILQLENLRRDNYCISSSFYSIMRLLYYNLNKFQCNSIFTLIVLHSQRLAILNKANYLKFDKIKFTYFTEREKTKLEVYLKNRQVLPKQITRQNFYHFIYNHNAEQLTPELFNNFFRVIKTFSIQQLQEYIFDMRQLFTCRSEYKILFLLLEELNEKTFNEDLNIGLIASKINFMKLWRSRPAIKFVTKACEYIRKGKNGFQFSNFRTYKRLLILLTAMRYEEESKQFIKFILSNSHNLPLKQQRSYDALIVRMPYQLSRNDIERISSNTSLNKINHIFFSLQNKLNLLQKEKMIQLILKHLSVPDHETKITIISYHQYLYLKKAYPKEMESVNLLQANFEDVKITDMSEGIRTIVESLQKYLGENFVKLPQFSSNNIFKVKNKFIVIFHSQLYNEFSVMQRQYLERMIKVIIDPNIEVCVLLFDSSQFAERPVKFHKLLTQSQTQEFYEKFFKRSEAQNVDRTLKNIKSPAFYVHQRRNQNTEKEEKQQNFKSNGSVGSMINKNRLRNVDSLRKK